MSELKPCPKCEKCSLGSKTEIVNLTSGAHFRCSWCEENTPISEDFLPIELINKIKTDAVRDFIERFKEPEDTSDTMYNWLKRESDKYTNKLKRGEL